MPDQPDCSNCNRPYADHHWHTRLSGVCPMRSLGVRDELYWPQDADGARAERWDPHPVLSPLEKVLVNNIETIRDVLDDWLPLADEDEITPAIQDLIQRAMVLRREIAEVTGELDDQR